MMSYHSHTYIGHTRVVVAADWISAESIVRYVRGEINYFFLFSYSLFFSASWDKSLLLWNIETGSDVLRMPNITYEDPYPPLPTDLHVSLLRKNLVAVSCRCDKFIFK